jgi:hypothetical protein
MRRHGHLRVVSPRTRLVRPALITERTEGVANKTVDLLKALGRDMAIATKRGQGRAKEIGCRACPHRFPMLRDGRYGQ